MPLRRLLDQASDVLFAIEPCWAMPPLMVSQVLPTARLLEQRISWTCACRRQRAHPPVGHSAGTCATFWPRLLFPPILGWGQVRAAG
jgi:hypothetical protein